MNQALTFCRPISRRGQVVVPKDIRAYLGIRDEVVFAVCDDHVEIRPAGDHFLEQFLSLPRKARSPSPAALKSMLEPRHANLR